MNQSRPKILFTCHGLHLGGVERSLIGLLRALPPSRVQFDLFLFEQEGSLLPQLPPNVRLLPEQAPYRALMQPVRHVLAGRYFLIGLVRLVARAVVGLRGIIGLSPGFLLARSHRYAAPLLPRVPGDYDLALSFLMPHDVVAKKVSARRKVGWIHTDYASVENGVATSLERKAWAEMDIIVAVSPDVAESFARIYPNLASRLIVIENILDQAWVRRQADDMSEAMTAKAVDMLTLCTVARFSHAKGIDLAVEAARLLKDRGLRFRWHIVGFGPDEAAIRRRIAELDISEEFILLGQRPNPYPWMKACDIYVQPSRYEGKAVSIREAQMLGKPVLVSDFSTVRSQVEHGVDGYVARAGVEGLVEGILKLATDVDLRAKLARTAAGRDYGNLAEVDKVLALLPDCCR